MLEILKWWKILSTFELNEKFRKINFFWIIRKRNNRIILKITIMFGVIFDSRKYSKRMQIWSNKINWKKFINEYKIEKN